MVIVATNTDVTCCIDTCHRYTQVYCVGYNTHQEMMSDLIFNLTISTHRHDGCIGKGSGSNRLTSALPPPLESWISSGVWAGYTGALSGSWRVHFTNDLVLIHTSQATLSLMSVTYGCRFRILHVKRLSTLSRQHDHFLAIWLSWKKVSIKIEWGGSSLLGWLLIYYTFWWLFFYMLCIGMKVNR